MKMVTMKSHCDSGAETARLLRSSEEEISILGKLPDRKVVVLIRQSLPAMQTMRITKLTMPCVSGRGREWTSVG